MKIGVIGSGIAGLVAAWQLSRAGHHVVVFEKNQQPGLAGAGIPLDAIATQIDVPLRLFNSSHWKLLSQVCSELEIELEAVDVSQSFSDERGRCYLNVDLHSIFGSNVSALLDPFSRNILRQARKLRSIGSDDLRTLDDQVQLDEYLSGRGFDSDFKDRFLYPILSATVCTCSVAALRNYPAGLILEVLANITPNGQLNNSLLRVKGGTREVQLRLLKGVAELRTGTNVVSIVRNQDVEVTVSKSQTTQVETFDHVIIATQANHVRRLLQRPSELESQMLSSFQYEQVEVVVHGDESFMPGDGKSWRSFNFSTQQTRPNVFQPMCTIWLNRFSDQYTFGRNLFQTINPLREPRLDQIVAKRRLGRPIVNHASGMGWQMLEKIHSEMDRNIWFVGSYASAGIPLLETAIESGIKVVQRLGGDISWLRDGLHTGWKAESVN